MSEVAASLAEWLRGEGLIAQADNAAIAAAWGDLAGEGLVSSPLASRADASAEAERQAAFFAAPLAEETILVAGRQSNLVGKSHPIVCDAEGYREGAAVFIIGAEDQDGGMTLLTVLRRLGE